MSLLPLLSNERATAAGATAPPPADVAWMPHCVGLHLDPLLVRETGIEVLATPMGEHATCPRCATPSTTVHSRYTRTVGDLPWGVTRVVLHLRPRRFRCRNGACRQRIFCERLPELTRVHSRQTHGLREARERLGFALGGRPGARLAARLRLGGNRMTLLRLVRAAPDPPGTGTATQAAPRHLGVDDWAQRRGHTYGTVLVDLDQQCPVDVLPDRTAETLAVWLATHPGAEVITRDRAGAYAEGARQGAPDAIQVADRWHVFGNLRDALERLLTRHHAAISTATMETPAPPGAGRMGDALDRPVPAAQEPTPATGDASRPPPPSAPVRARRASTVALQRARRTRLRARYEAVVAQHAQGKSLRAIATALRLSRTTVQRYVRAAQAGGLPERQPRRTQPTPLARFDAYLRKRWAEGCHNALTLWRELQAQGYSGGKTTVRDYVQAWRGAPAATLVDAASVTGNVGNVGNVGDAGGPAGPPRSAHAAHRPLTPSAPPSVREVTWRLLRRPVELTTDELAFLEHLFRQAPEVGVAHGLAQDFAALIRDRAHWQQEPGALASWVRVATASAIPE
jgi:transposase